MQRFQQTRHALGSTAYITITLADDDMADAIFETLWQQIEEFEKRFSRFLQDSELSKFNTAAGTRQTISEPFHKLLTTAKHVAEKSDGLYNPFILPALQRAGYKGSWPQPQKAESTLMYEDRIVANWHDIAIGRGWAMIPESTALDLGGIGKGYLLDELAQTLRIKDVENYWLSLGGDILCSGYDASGDSWRIGIQDARDEGKVIASVKNDGDTLAVATSGITKRQGVAENGPWHHIIDPRTGMPAQTDSLTVTVCADNAITADVTAKCLVIAGSMTADKILSTMNVKQALFQKKDNTVVKVGTTWLA